jgi:hypothetical protein
MLSPAMFRFRHELSAGFHYEQILRRYFSYADFHSWPERHAITYTADYADVTAQIFIEFRYADDIASHYFDAASITPFRRHYAAIIFVDCFAISAIAMADTPITPLR